MSIIFNQLKKNLNSGQKILNNSLANLPGVIGYDNVRGLSKAQAAINKVNLKMNGITTIASSVGATLGGLGITSPNISKILGNITTQPDGVGRSYSRVQERETISDQIEQSRNKYVQMNHLTFPLDVGQMKSFMALYIKEYKRDAAFDSTEITTDNIIYLPLPETLQETHSLAFDEQEIGIVEDVIEQSGMLANFMGSGAAGANLDTLKKIAKAVGEVTASSTTRMAINSLNTAFAGAGDVFSQYRGKIPNPNPSIFFKGLRLRGHTFIWKLVPKNAEESNQLKNIIMKIKQSFLPEKEGTYLKYPNIVLPKIMGQPGPDGGNWLYDYKPCACQTIQVNYTPDGSSAFHNNGSPVAIMLTLELKELEYYLSSDVTGI